jgi:hypoxanthine phosphoribosyltransferase
LPPLRWLQQPDQDRFAHPAEIELARLLTFYGIRWAYEPTTFALRGDGDGPGQEYVTPDFYLPDHDLYLELTTMRQRLVTRKNRKFRKLRERYPNVQCRILYLRDFQRLQDAYGPRASHRGGKLGALLFTEEEIGRRIAELADQLVATWQPDLIARPCRRPLLLGIGRGSTRFLSALGESARACGCAVDIDRIELTSVADGEAGDRARVSRLPGIAVAGRQVTIVQEVLSTGLSATFLERWLRRHGANGVDVCALLDREAAHVLDITPICRGFSVPDVPLAGFGLDRWGAFRDLPFVSTVDPE